MSAHASESSETQHLSLSSNSQPNRRSKVWRYFEPNLVPVDDSFKAVCKYCGLHLSTKSGTSSLRTHISEYCPAIDDASRKEFISTMKKRPSENFVFDPQLSREYMIDYIVHAEIPFNKFDDPYFERKMKIVHPDYPCVKRQTIRNDSLKMFEKMKRNLQNELGNLDSRVCLTSDLWTSVQNLGYIVVTAHYITADFKLIKKIISFKDVKYPHTGAAIEEALVSCLTEWGIREKVFTLTMDNAGNNNRACDIFVQYQKHELMLEGAHFHVRCCAHVLNILVQDGMNIIHDAIRKIRELLKHMVSSPSRIQAFNQIAIGVGLPAKRGIALDIPNRWNSTFKMIGEALKYKVVLNSYAYQYAKSSPSAEEWAEAEAIHVFLKAFELATNLVSADRTPTAHMFLPLVLSIRHCLNDSAWQTSALLKDVAAAMKIKFEKYWGPNVGEENPNPFSLRKKDYDFNLAIAISTLLDPRRKGEYVECFYRKVSRNEQSANTCLNSALEWMRKYFSEYERRVMRDVSYTYSPVASSSLVGSPVLGGRQIEEEFENFRSSRRRANATKSEIDTYFEHEYVPSDSQGFDILVWWKSRAEKYPVLSAMAREFLAVPLSTVSSESAFSLGGRLLGEARSSLTPEMLEALVCGKDWLFVEKDEAIDNQAASNEGGNGMNTASNEGGNGLSRSI